MFVRTFVADGVSDRSYMIVDKESGRAAVVDAQRDVWTYLDEADNLGVKITHTFDTHVHNDFVSGSRSLQELTGATVVQPAGSEIEYNVREARDGDRFEVGGFTVRALHTPGHTFHHTAYAVEEGGVVAGLFTGGSMLVETVGRTDLVSPGATEELAARPALLRPPARRLPRRYRGFPNARRGFVLHGGRGARPRNDVDRSGEARQRRGPGRARGGRRRVRPLRAAWAARVSGLLCAHGSRQPQGSAAADLAARAGGARPAQGLRVAIARRERGRRAQDARVSGRFPQGRAQRAAGRLVRRLHRLGAPVQRRARSRATAGRRLAARAGPADPHRLRPRCRLRARRLSGVARRRAARRSIHRDRCRRTPPPAKRAAGNSASSTSARTPSGAPDTYRAPSTSRSA